MQDVIDAIDSLTATAVHLDRNGFHVHVNYAESDILHVRCSVEDGDSREWLLNIATCDSVNVIAVETEIMHLSDEEQSSREGRAKDATERRQYEELKKKYGDAA